MDLKSMLFGGGKIVSTVISAIEWVKAKPGRRLIVESSPSGIEIYAEESGQRVSL